MDDSKFLMKAVIVLAALVAAALLMSTVSAAKASIPDTKLDVGIYEGINPVGCTPKYLDGNCNPVAADPKDYTVFTFHVTAIEVKYTDAGTVIERTEHDVGYFTARQMNAGSFPMENKPYSDRYCAGYKVGGLCVGTWINVEGYYHIDNYQIPEGYCPEYPFGQDRKTGGTSEAVFKFYKGDACRQLYSHFDGKFGTCTKDFRRCYIIVR